MTSGRLLLNTQHLGALELDHLMAVDADEMLVDGGASEQVLVSLEAFTEIMLLDEAAADEDLDRSIDRRLADSLPRPSKQRLDVFHREVT